MPGRADSLTEGHRVVYCPIREGGAVKIDLGHIEAEPLRIDERFELPPDRLDPSVVLSPVEVRARIEISAASPGYRLRGRFSMSGSLRCVRCLKSVDSRNAIR